MAEGRKRAGFRRVTRGAASAADPRELFRDLQRDAGVPFLWEHQGRILERYEQHFDSPHVALELPTGTGKTLIGLLIAEWRRRTRDERSLYLCPTRQLANQVGELAPRYGIRAEVCLAPDYEGLDDWLEGRSIAVSTYSGLFNYRPKFVVPQTLILDDAHAAEEYVASHWTVTVDREDMPSTYRKLAALLDPLLDRFTAGILADDLPRPEHRTTVDVVPLPRWWPLMDGLRDLIESQVQDTDQFFAWDHHVRAGLPACNLLVSWQQIVLRPLVPATAKQTDFQEANQRVYMSATLGAGGELERIFGVRNIERLPVPDEWQRHSTGRRLFLLPGGSLPREQADSVVERAVKRAGRALVLAPSRQVANSRRDQLKVAGIPTLDAGDIEESLRPFTTQEHAALVLANRYDGIDLPGNQCRLLVLDGLPVAVNPLERFLFERLAATGLLGERMRTRLTQGVGRCSRGEGDWSTVLVASREAYDFCARTEIRSMLHPELQGELRFGLDESRDREADEYLELMDVQFEQGQEWAEAEEQIRGYRDDAVKHPDPAAKQLEAAVADEVGFVYAMWDGDFPRALDRASAVVDALSGEAAEAYRAWWLYQAGCAAWLAHTSFGLAGMELRARELFASAGATGRSVSWFTELAYGQLGGEVDLDATPEDLRIAERVHARLRRIGFNGPRFSQRTDRMQERLLLTDPTPFEEGLTDLGRLLGYEADHPAGDNDPDSVWVASDRFAVVWEAKSQEASDGEVGARAAQQTAGHRAWTLENRHLARDARVLTLLASDRTRVARSAIPHVDDVRIVRLDEIRNIAEEVTAALARVRARGATSDDASLRALIVSEFSASGLLPSSIQARLGARRLDELPQGG